MASIFNYNTIQVSLKKDTRTLIIELNRPETKNAINSEMIFELEGLFSWCVSHIEINSILISSTTDDLSCGLDKDEAKNMGEEKLVKNFSKLQKLIYSMFFLPQTIIIDMKNGTSGIAAELAIGADIRLAKEGSSISFNHLSYGITPSCGGIGFLSAITNRSTARNWILSSAPISKEALLSSGFVQEFYNEESCSEKYLQMIAAQPPVTRIQTKRSFLEPIMDELDETLHFEERFAKGNLGTGDWRKAMNGEKNFTPPLQLAAFLKTENNETEATN